MIDEPEIEDVLEYRGRYRSCDVKFVRRKNDKCLVRFLDHPRKHPYWVNRRNLYSKE